MALLVYYTERAARLRRAAIQNALYKDIFMAFPPTEVNPQNPATDVIDDHRDDPPETDPAPEPARKPQRRPIRRSLVRPTPAAVKAAMRFLFPVRPR